MDIKDNSLETMRKTTVFVMRPRLISMSKHSNNPFFSIGVLVGI